MSRGFSIPEDSVPGSNVVEPLLELRFSKRKRSSSWNCLIAELESAGLRDGVSAGLGIGADFFPTFPSNGFDVDSEEVLEFISCCREKLDTLLLLDFNSDLPKRGF